jgi:ketosteroid isomerase-like protein
MVIRKWIMLIITLAIAGCTQKAQMVAKNTEKEKQTSATIIAMEKAALDRWGKGDPSGFLEISASDVVYFDPSLDKRLNGIDELETLYENVRGKIHVDRYELIDPKVQLCGNVTVLTFNYVGYSDDKVDRWNCTEVYRNQNGRWEIIQTHWSFTKPTQ